jgi:hypothetical protein
MRLEKQRKLFVTYKVDVYNDLKERYKSNMLFIDNFTVGAKEINHTNWKMIDELLNSIRKTLNENKQLESICYLTQSANSLFILNNEVCHPFWVRYMSQSLIHMADSIGQFHTKETKPILEDINKVHFFLLLRSGRLTNNKTIKVKDGTTEKVYNIGLKPFYSPQNYYEIPYYVVKNSSIDYFYSYYPLKKYWVIGNLQPEWEKNAKSSWDRITKLTLFQPNQDLEIEIWKSLEDRPVKQLLDPLLPPKDFHEKLKTPPSATSQLPTFLPDDTTVVEVNPIFVENQFHSHPVNYSDLYLLTKKKKYVRIKEAPKEENGLYYFKLNNGSKEIKKKDDLKLFYPKDYQSTQMRSELAQISKLVFNLEQNVVSTEVKETLRKFVEVESNPDKFKLILDKYFKMEYNPPVVVKQLALLWLNNKDIVIEVTKDSFIQDNEVYKYIKTCLMDIHEPDLLLLKFQKMVENETELSQKKTFRSCSDFYHCKINSVEFLFGDKRHFNLINQETTAATIYVFMMKTEKGQFKTYQKFNVFFK